MKTKTPLRLVNAIHDVINELDEDTVINVNTRIFMGEALEKFCIHAIRKFIAGQKEHGGDLLKRDCFADLTEEHVDMFWYISAEHKTRK